MIGLAIKLLGIGKAIRNGIGAAFAWATANTARMLAVACLVIALWGWWGWHGKGKAEKVLASTEQGYRNAQKDAEIAQAALNARQVATNEAINKGSTDANAKGLDAARSAVAAYVRMHPATRCAPGPAQPAAMPDNPGVAAGPGGEAGMVAVSVADLDQLAAGTVRAESCRALGRAWIDGGLAEMGD